MKKSFFKQAYKQTVEDCKEQKIIPEIMQDGSIYFTPLAEIIFWKHYYILADKRV